MASFLGRIKRAWNIFVDNEKNAHKDPFGYGSYSVSGRTDALGISIFGGDHLMSSIYNQLSIDIATVDIKHIMVDENDMFVKEVAGSITDRLTISPNIDQVPTQFRQNLALSILQKGHAVIVPVETSEDPNETGTFEYYQLRVGEVVTWYPDSVLVKVYDQRRGDSFDIKIPKEQCAIITNPHYLVMNEQNSTLRRLIRKLRLLDVLDERANSGQIDLIIQLPHVVRSEVKREEAERRRKEIESQLKEAEYGVAYIDATERITQLNRPAESNLLKEIQYLTERLYSELGLSPEIFTGSADEQTMLNYFNRMIEPVLSSITEEMNRKFLTMTARTRGHRITFLRNPFKLIPINNIAELADKFTRNEILTSNEVRGIIGYQPSKDPKADELRNSNIAAPKEEAPMEKQFEQVEENQNGT